MTALLLRLEASSYSITIPWALGVGEGVGKGEHGVYTLRALSNPPPIFKKFYWDTTLFIYCPWLLLYSSGRSHMVQKPKILII